MAVVAVGGLMAGREFDSLVLVSLGIVLLGLTQLYFGLTREAALRESLMERQRLLERGALLSAHENRRTVARVGDSLVQHLAAASFGLGAAAASIDPQADVELTESLDTVASSIRESMRSAQSLMIDTYPSSLTGHGLEVVLANLLAPLEDQGVSTDLQVGAIAALPTEKQHLAIRAVSEAVRNTEEHANASELWVSIVLSDDSVVVEVKDDGRGFDVAALGRRQAAGRLGLRLLDDLACEQGAVVAVATEPGSGTTLRLEIPT